MKMFSTVLASAMLASALLTSTAAIAKSAFYQLDVAYDGSAYYASDFSGASIKFLGDYDKSSGLFTATSATGTVNGNAVTGISNYGSADYKLFVKGPFLDYNGVSVSDGTKDYNFFSDTTAFRGLYNEIDSGFSTGNATGERHVFLAGTVGGVPEPDSWALFVAGFGLVGVMARRRSLSSVTA